MKITVINGSPKGSNSITLQTILYLQKNFPDINFSILNAGAKINALEKAFAQRNDRNSADENLFIDAISQIINADLIIFSYPVYTFLVPSQLHRFVEMMKESGCDFTGKYVTQLSTSKHFYDITAHRFIEDNCIDMGMKCIKGLSADMEDLTKRTGRKQAVDFLNFAVWEMAENGSPAANEYLSMHPAPLKDISEMDAVIVTDCEPGNEKLNNMIESFRKELKCSSRVVNIRDINMKGGCLGCFNCAATGTCIYKDDYAKTLRDNIQSAKGTVYAFTVKDHSMGSLFKTFDDRQFCNGHRTVTMGSPIAYIVDGDMTVEPNLKFMLESRADVGGNYLAGIADSTESINQTAARFNYSLAAAYNPPQTFTGIGGMRIFRDLIYLMQGLMREDHKFFKSHGQYDFPQKRKGTILSMYLVGFLFSNKKLRKKMGGKINEGMLMPYKKALERNDK